MQLSDRIGRRLKLQDLHVLMTVVQAGTMGKAAQQLNTTQPNISRAIALPMARRRTCFARFPILRSTGSRLHHTPVL